MGRQPNVLLIMTDEERYPPPYEDDSSARFRREHLPARQELRARGVELHRHYVGSTACVPSRATLFTGHYPSLHGVAHTDGLAKQASDPDMSWLDPDSVPTMGDWFRAGGYRTHYRGKWHISHADLLVPGTHESLMASDDQGRVVPAGVEAYRRADRLDPFGFSGWIGREPHGAARADTGSVRDGVFADQVVTLFDELAAARDEGPWLAVASFVNPHDIAFSGAGWDLVVQLPGPDDSVPEVAEAPSQADGFDRRPPCHQAWTELWPLLLYPQPADLSYRRLYYHLHAVVDRVIGRVLDALERSGMAEETIVVLTSDHGDLLGAHGGMVQKWYNAFDETTRVPMVVAGPGIATPEGGYELPTSHVDVLPTLLGLAGIDMERAAAEVAERHIETTPLVGRDLSGLLTGSSPPATFDEPVYFMTDDDISRGLQQANRFTGQPFEPVPRPSRLESLVARLPSAPDGGVELWKLNHYFERLEGWDGAPGHGGDERREPASPFLELHNLSRDPDERDNCADREVEARTELEAMLAAQREAKRKVPSLRNPPG